jgi:bifunctional NMN adenylyltransferase/nudix hydrolase
MKYPHAFALVVGRFQPFHLAHQQLLEMAFARAGQVIVALGSHRAASTIKNPWTTTQREQMIRACLVPEHLARVHFITVRDYLYNDNLWAAELQAKVHEIVGETKEITLIGHHKDPSSYYLDAFPQWQVIEHPQRLPISATEIREQYFRGQAEWQEQVSPTICEFLTAFAQTPRYTELVEEQKFIDQYREDWSVAPHPPIFVTVDAVVFKSGHILVVRRRGQPGKGLFALPGGFVRTEEWLEQAAIRELREETGLRVSSDELRKHIRATRVFDHPERSLRGRTITNGYYVNLGAVGELPAVKGNADAAKAFWMTLNDVYINEDRFFEDHVSIITHFINRF